MYSFRSLSKLSEIRDAPHHDTGLGPTVPTLPIPAVRGKGWRPRVLPFPPWRGKTRRDDLETPATPTTPFDAFTGDQDLAAFFIPLARETVDD